MLDIQMPSFSVPVVVSAGAGAAAGGAGGGAGGADGAGLGDGVAHGGGEDGELSLGLGGTAFGADDLLLRRTHQALEVLAALPAAIFVDGHDCRYLTMPSRMMAKAMAKMATVSMMPRAIILNNPGGVDW